MYQIQLKFKGQTKKITVQKSLQPQELGKMIVHSFGLNERVVGVTDRPGKFYELSKINSDLAGKDVFTLVTAKDIKQESMSFASEYYQRQSRKQFDEDPEPTEPTLDIPAVPVTRCLGIISDIEMFEGLILTEGKITIVACFASQKPQDLSYEHFLYQNESKNSVMIYSGISKVCEFYVNDWAEPNQEVGVFIEGLLGENAPAQNVCPFSKSEGFTKKNKAAEGELMERPEELEEELKGSQLKRSFIENLTRLLEEGELSQLEFYKLKAQVLENPKQFMRKYQMGTHSGLRGDSRDVSSKEERREFQSKEERRERGRSGNGNRNKRYQIPIIVRKYNNVVEKISTSYPLSREQEQAINLILELQLKGLITEKEAGQFKSLILQEENDTFKLFQEYFQDNMDQLQLAAKLKSRRYGGQREDSRQKGEHDMRLLIKYAKQNSYELLRKLALEGNKHVLRSLSAFRETKDTEQLVSKLQKIANYYRAKQDLEEQDSL